MNSVGGGGGTARTISLYVAAMASCYNKCHSIVLDKIM